MPVYFIRAGRTDRIKIGYAVKPEHRLRELQIGSADRLTFLRVVEGEREAERAMHARFADQRLEGEWFTFDPDMLTVEPEQIASTINAPLRDAIALLGGQVATAKVVMRCQAVVSDWLNGSNQIPVEACMRLEVATDGKLLAEQLRPDLAADFNAFRTCQAIFGPAHKTKRAARAA
jgi:DNA-binding transcriptional regulator YdaS (Cro superfamily)